MIPTKQLIYLLCLLILPLSMFGQYCSSEDDDDEGGLVVMGFGELADVEVGIVLDRGEVRRDRFDHDDDCRCFRRGRSYYHTAPGTRVYDLTDMHEGCREDFVEGMMEDFEDDLGDPREESFREFWDGEETTMIWRNRYDYVRLLYSEGPDDTWLEVTEEYR